MEDEIENKKAQILNLQQHLSALEKDIKCNEELLRRYQLHYKELKVRKHHFILLNMCVRDTPLEAEMKDIMK